MTPHDRSRERIDRPRRSGAPKRSEGVRRKADEAKYPGVHLSDEIVKELHATARPGKGEILVKVFSEAAGAFANDDFVEAMRLAEQAKHIALRSASVRELLGLALYRAGKWQEAARELAAFRRMSGSTEQNPVIADSYRALKRPDKALEYTAEVHRAEVPDAIYYENEIVGAGALADMNEVGKAIERLEKLDLRPDVAREHHFRTWYMLGDLYEKLGRYTQARTWFEAVEGADPELTDAPKRARKLKMA